MLLGAGRETVDGIIDPAVGLVVDSKIGDRLSAGDPLVTIHYNDDRRLEEVERLLAGAYHIQEEPPVPVPLVHKILDPTEET